MWFLLCKNLDKKKKNREIAGHRDALSVFHGGKKLVWVTEEGEIAL